MTHTKPNPFVLERNSSLRMSTQFLDIGTAQVAHYAIGPDDAPPLLFVHGWPLHAATWRKVVPFFAADFRCHLIDLPGTGQTHSDNGATVSIDGHTETLRRVVKALGLTRYALVAHDSGGAFCRYLAEGNDDVTALVLANTEIPNWHPPLIPLLMKLCRLPGALWAYTRELKIDSVKKSKLGFGGCFVDTALIDGAFDELFVQPMIDDASVRKGQARLLRDFDLDQLDGLDKVHARITANTLLLWGDRDRFFPLDQARALPSQFGGACSLEVIEGTRLLPHEEKPAEFAERALTFLKRAHCAVSTAA